LTSGRLFSVRSAAVLFDVIQESVLCLSLLFSRFLKEVQNGGLLIASGLSDLGFYTEPINILNGVGE
jgi:hypothetical protein